MRWLGIFLLLAGFNSALAQSPEAGIPTSTGAEHFQVERLPRNGFDLYYHVAGAGEPVLILSGGPGDDCDYLMPVAADVAKSAEAILPELRGTGRSLPPIIDQTTISLTAYLDDIEALRIKLHVKRWTVIGHSAGGLWAMRYVAAHPKAVDKLVLLDSVPVASEFLAPLNDNILDRFSPAERNQLADLEQSAAADTQHQAALLQAQAFFFDRTLGVKIAADMAKTYHANVAHLLSGELFPAGGYDLRPALKNFDGCVLVLNGRQDPMDPEMAAQTAAAFRHSTLKFVDRAGHFSWFEQPAQFGILLEAFLRGKCPTPQ